MLLPRAISATRSCLVLAALFLTISAVSAQGGRGDWYMSGHDPQHTRRSLFVGPATADQKWECYTGDEYGVSSPAIGAEGCIYVGSGDCRLYAINPDGTKRWGFLAADAVWDSPAIASDGTVYMRAGNGALYAIGTDGCQKWTFGNWTKGDPQVGPDDTVYVNAWPKSLYAVNPDGSQKWVFSDSANSPVFGLDGTIYTNSDSGTLYALNPNGSERWHIDGSGQPVAVGSDGSLFVQREETLGTRLRALDANGLEKWNCALGTYWNSTGLAADGTIRCLGSYLGEAVLSRVSADGWIQWTYRLGGYSYAPPIIDAAGTTYASSSNGLCAIAADGSLKWRSDLGRGYAGMAIGSDGTLYLASDDDKLYAIGPGQTPVAPYVSVSQPSSPGTINGPISYSINYMYATAVTLTEADISLICTGTANGTVSVAGEGNTSRTVTISGITGEGTINIAIAAATASNAVGNSLAAGPAQPFEVASKRIDPGDWRAFAHDAQHTGRSRYAGPAVPAQIWELNLDDYPSRLSGPVLDADGTIYVATDWVIAINPDGTEKKRYPCRYGLGPTSIGIGPAGTLLARTYDNALTSISAQGSEWQLSDYSWYASTSPVVASNGTVYIGDDLPALRALGSDGRLKWKLPLQSYLDIEPVVGQDGTIYVQPQNWTIYAINPDGSEKWHYKTDGMMWRPASV